MASQLSEKKKTGNSKSVEENCSVSKRLCCAQGSFTWANRPLKENLCIPHERTRQQVCFTLENLELKEPVSDALIQFYVEKIKCILERKGNSSEILQLLI